MNQSPARKMGARLKLNVALGWRLGRYGMWCSLREMWDGSGIDGHSDLIALRPDTAVTTMP